MISIEKIKENIKCPQFGDLEYGEWGALRLEQRIAYKELIEEIERLQHNQKVSTKWEIKLTQKNTKLIEENKKLHSIIKEAREYIKEKVGNEIHDMMYVIDVSEVLEILDKVEEK